MTTPAHPSTSAQERARATSIQIVSDLEKVLDSQWRQILREEIEEALLAHGLAERRAGREDAATWVAAEGKRLNSKGADLVAEGIRALPLPGDGHE